MFVVVFIYAFLMHTFAPLCSDFSGVQELGPGVSRRDFRHLSADGNGNGRIPGEEGVLHEGVGQG